MSYAPDNYERDFYQADAGVNERVAFLKRVYAHVFGAIVALVALIAIFISTGIAAPITALLMKAWWLTLLAFMAVSWLAEKWAYSGASQQKQYAGLGLYVLAEAIIMTPLLYIAHSVLEADDLIMQAGFLTLLIFGGLTAVVMMTKADFSFLRGIVVVGGFAALGIIFGGMIFGFDTGLWFSVGMVALLSVTILYQTSEIYHRFPPTAHVAAALALFGAIATLFYYVLRLLIALSDD